MQLIVKVKQLLVKKIFPDVFFFFLPESENWHHCQKQMDNELSVLCHVPRGSAAPGYLHHSLTDTLSSGFSDHDALGAVSPLCHEAWGGGVAPIFQRACCLHSSVQ